MRLNEDLANAVAEAIRLLYSRGLVQVKGGNVSAFDRQAGLVYITPTGVPRHLVKPDDIAVVSLDGKVVVGNPSSELMMHLEIYKGVSDAVAVVHAHPVSVLALYESGGRLDLSLTTEARIRTNCVEEVPPLQPGSEELARATAAALSRCRAAVLRGHGITAYSSKDVFEALDAVEALSDLAMVQLYSAAGKRAT